MVNFGPLTAEIGSGVWGTPTNFNGFCVLYFISINAHARTWHTSTSGLKSHVTIVFLDPNFLSGAEIPAIREHLRQKLSYLCLHGSAWTFGPKIVVLGQNRGRLGAMLTPKELVLTLEVITSVPLLAKIDQEMRPWDADRQRQTEFAICPTLYAIAMGQIDHLYMNI